MNTIIPPTRYNSYIPRAKEGVFTHRLILSVSNEPSITDKTMGDSLSPVAIEFRV